MFKLEVRKPVW